MELTLYNYLTLLIPRQVRHFRIYDGQNLIIEGCSDEIIWSNDEYKGIPIAMLEVASVSGKDDIIDILVRVS